LLADRAAGGRDRIRVEGPPPSVVRVDGRVRRDVRFDDVTSTLRFPELARPEPNATIEVETTPVCPSR
jgi:hypothetical protein